MIEFASVSDTFLTKTRKEMRLPSGKPKLASRMPCLVRIGSRKASSASECREPDVEIRP